MNEFVALFSDNFEYVCLFFLRISGLIITSPIFGRKNVPALVRIAFCLVMTYFSFTVIPVPTEPVAYAGLMGYLLLCASELLFGVVMGYALTMFFNLTFIGGQLIDTQIGFGIVSVYDIQNRSQVPLIGNMLNIMLLLVFYGVNGHHRLLSIMFNSFYQVPVGQVTLSTDLALSAIESFSLAFTLGVMVAMPIIASGLLLEIVLGVLIRAVPQMNMFVIGIPIKLLLGLIVLFLTIPVFITFSDRIFTDMFVTIETFFRLLGTPA